MSSTILSSQDFRNSYEYFYEAMRNYLWPYDTLKKLGEVECDIFTSFIDFDKLRLDLDKLYSAIRDTIKDDEELQKRYDEINELLEASKDPDVKLYSKLGQVNEVNPENTKTIRVIPEEEDTI